MVWGELVEGNKTESHLWKRGQYLKLPHRDIPLNGGKWVSETVNRRAKSEAL